MNQTPLRRPLPDTRNAGAAYWRSAAEGRLCIPHCDRCTRAFWYPRQQCPHCGSNEVAWIQARGTGRVHTYTVVRQSGDPFFKARLPFVVAMIELDEGPILMSNIIDCDVESVAIDMAVVVSFEQAQDGLAIPLFRSARPPATT